MFPISSLKKSLRLLNYINLSIILWSECQGIDSFKIQFHLSKYMFISPVCVPPL